MSQHQWGRSNDAGRQPTRVPIYTLLILPLALSAGIGMAVYQYRVSFSTLQRWYLTDYLKSTYTPRQFLPTGTYQLVDQVGDQYIARPPQRYAHVDMEPWLRETVYDGQPVTRLAWWPITAAACVALFGLCGAIPLDARRLRTLRDGTILRGGARPRTVSEFNRLHRTNDGIQIRVKP
jgi:hypothetical protein